MDMVLKVPKLCFDSPTDVEYIPRGDTAVLSGIDAIAFASEHIEKPFSGLATPSECWAFSLGTNGKSMEDCGIR